MFSERIYRKYELELFEIVVYVYCEIRKFTLKLIKQKNPGIKE